MQFVSNYTKTWDDIPQTIVGSVHNRRKGARLLGLFIMFFFPVGNKILISRTECKIDNMVFLKYKIFESTMFVLFQNSGSILRVEL